MLSQALIEIIEEFQLFHCKADDKLENLGIVTKISKEIRTYPAIDDLSSTPFIIVQKTLPSIAVWRKL